MQRTADRKDPQPTRKAAPRFDPRTSCGPSPSTDSGSCITGAEGTNVSVWDCGSPLYDSYELVSLFNQLDKGFHPPPPGAIDHSGSSNCNGRLEIPYYPSFSTRFIFENMNVECECKKLKKHRLRWFFRLVLNISRVLALWARDADCPRHRPFKTDYRGKCTSDSVHRVAWRMSMIIWEQYMFLGIFGKVDNQSRFILTWVY